MMFEDRSLKIITYNIETIIAEKYQTVIDKGVLNSRMKDYYDLYYLLTYKEYSEEKLKEAIVNTFNKRETDLNNTSMVLQEIEKSEFTQDLWGSYAKKHSYTQDVKFEDVITSIRKVEELINI